MGRPPSFVLAGLCAAALGWTGPARGDALVPTASPCPDGVAAIGSARAQAAPVVDTTLPADEALAVWRDDLIARYRSCNLAPFEPERADLSERGSAYSHELGRTVGAFRVKPDVPVSAELGRSLEILDVELPGNQKGALQALASLTTLLAWPMRTNGEVVKGCRVEVAQGHRAELCLDMDGVDRAESSVVSTQVRTVVICPAALAADDVSLVWLSPIAPAPLSTVIVEKSPGQVASFASSFTVEEPSSRELACSEGRAWCVGITAQGGFALTHGAEAKPTAVKAEDLDGFMIAAPGAWSGVELLASGVRLARSGIGSYHGIPSANQIRWWLASDRCMSWKKKPQGKRYPARVELGSMCLVDGAWIEGMQMIAPLRGEPRPVMQSRYLDDIATRCHYTE